LYELCDRDNNFVIKIFDYKLRDYDLCDYEFRDHELWDYKLRENDLRDYNLCDHDLRDYNLRDFGLFPRLFRDHFTVDDISGKTRHQINNKNVKLGRDVQECEPG